MAKRTQKRRGPKTPFEGARIRGSISMTKLAWKLIRKASSRSERNVSNVFELLSRKHAGAVRREDFGAWS